MGDRKDHGRMHYAATLGSCQMALWVSSHLAYIKAMCRLLQSIPRPMNNSCLDEGAWLICSPFQPPMLMASYHILRMWKYSGSLP